MKTFIEMVLAINQSKLTRSIKEYGELYWSDAFFPDEMISKNGESHLSENGESHMSENLSENYDKLVAPVLGIAVAAAETVAPAMVQIAGIVGATTAITSIADSTSKAAISYMERTAQLAKENAENDILRIKLEHQHQEHQRDAELAAIQKVNDNAGVFNSSTSQEALKTIASTHDAPVAPPSPLEELVIGHLRADLDDRAANRDVDVADKWVGVGRDAFSLAKDVVGSLDPLKELWIFGSS
jgi:hypothetical protein